MRPRTLTWSVVAAFVVALEVACRSGLISPFVMIAPSQMVVALAQMAFEAPWFWPDLAFTGRNFIAAVALSVIGGGAIGIAIHPWPRLREAVAPLLTAYYSVPTFAFYPVLIVFFGIGPASLIAMGAVFGVVAMIVAMLTALDRIPPVMLKAARVHGLGPLRSKFLVSLPAIAPYLFSGLKLSVAYCLIGVIASEFILSTAGIGRRLSLAYNDFDNRTMYGVLLFIILFSACLTAAMNAAERRIRARWGR